MHDQPRVAHAHIDPASLPIDESACVTDASAVYFVDLEESDPAKARKELGWQPSVDFKGLVHMMVDADLARLEAGQLIA